MSSLSSSERAALRRLRETYCNEAFDPAGEETDRQLRTIWWVAFPDDPIEDTQPGEHWKRLGFQSATPRTDVRAGRLALDQLHYLATEHPEDFRRLAQEAEGLGYPFACSCFNVTQILAQFFGLYRKEAVMPVAGAGKATAEQRRNFARLCSNAPEGPRLVLDELFCALAELLHRTWGTMHRANGLNLMDFPVVLRKVHQANATFWQRQRAGVADFALLLGEGTAAPSPGLGVMVLEAAGQLQAALQRAGSGASATAAAAAAREEAMSATELRGSEVELSWMPPRRRSEEAAGRESASEPSADENADARPEEPLQKPSDDEDAEAAPEERPEGESFAERSSDEDARPRAQEPSEGEPSAERSADEGARAGAMEPVDRESSSEWLVLEGASSEAAEPVETEEPSPARSAAENAAATRLQAVQRGRAARRRVEESRALEAAR